MMVNKYIQSIRVNIILNIVILLAAGATENKALVLLWLISALWLIYVIVKKIATFVTRKSNKQESGESAKVTPSRTAQQTTEPKTADEHASKRSVQSNTSDSKNLKTFRFNVEYAGEIGFGKLSDEDAKKIKKAIADGTIEDTDFFQAPYSYTRESYTGIWSYDAENEVPNANFETAVKSGIPTDKDGEPNQPGVYLYYGSLSETSHVEFKADPENLTFKTVLYEGPTGEFSCGVDVANGDLCYAINTQGEELLMIDHIKDDGLEIFLLVIEVHEDGDYDEIYP